MSKTISQRRFRGVGIDIAADVGGDPAAPAVILLHGGGQTRHSWRGAMRELVARGYYVINLDARGHGETDWSPDGEYSMELLAGDLRAIIDPLPGKPALVGASMGGITSLYTVGHAKEDIASALVMVDIVPRMNPDGADKIRNFMTQHRDGFATLDEAADAVAAYNPTRPRPKDSSGLMRNLRQRNGRLYWHWDPAFVGREHAPADLPNFALTLNQAAAHIRAPALLVRGMMSDVVSDEGVAEFRATIPHLEVFDVAGAGHMVAGDRNDAFNQGVLSFLERHHPASATSPGAKPA